MQNISRKVLLLFVIFQVYSSIQIDENPVLIQTRLTWVGIKIIHTIDSFISPGRKGGFIYLNISPVYWRKAFLKKSSCCFSVRGLLITLVVQTMGKHKIPSPIPTLSVTHHYYLPAQTDSGLQCKAALLDVVQMRHWAHQRCVHQQTHLTINLIKPSKRTAHDI